MIILVHGISTPMFIWKYQMKALLNSGFQVLRYDLFGRGLSDRPFGEYTEKFFNRQLVDLLDVLDIDTFHGLVGLSLGGAIAVNFAARMPDRFKKLFLIAPAGLQEFMPWWFYMAIFPGIIDSIAYGVGKYYWKKIGPHNLSSDSKKQKEAKKHLERQLSFDGLHRAMISTLRYGPVYGQRKAYRKVAKSNIPVRVAWSREDTVVPFRMSETLKNIIPDAEVIGIRDGRHTLNYDRPETVNPPLLDFL